MPSASLLAVPLPNRGLILLDTRRRAQSPFAKSQFVISTASENGETIWKVDVRVSQSLLSLPSQQKKLEWFQGIEQLVFYAFGLLINRMESIFVKNFVLELDRYQCQSPIPFRCTYITGGR